MGGRNDPRRLALEALSWVLDRGHALDAFWVRHGAADERDRALARALATGVLRHLRRLEALRDALLERPLKRRGRDVGRLLAMALFELQHHRTPAYAVVSETVAAAPAWARPLVNAVLRRWLRERPASAAEDAPPPVRYSLPDWLWSAFAADWPEDAAAIAEASLAQPPLVLRVNRRRTSPEACRRALEAAGLAAAPVPGCPEALCLDSPVPVSALPGFAEGWVSVQDAAAQWPAPLLDPRPGERVLDACAAPGSKTFHLLERQPRLARLVAVDVDAERLARIEADRRRLGWTEAPLELHCADAAAPESWWDGTPFDAILLDVPCSGTGVLRRHPDIKWLRRPEDIPALAERQLRLLEAAADMLAPGGRLLYCSCSVLRAENEAVVAAVLARRPELRPQPLAERLPGARPCAVGVQWLPGVGGRDGFYYALLRRV